MSHIINKNTLLPIGVVVTICYVVFWVGMAITKIEAHEYSLKEYDRRIEQIEKQNHEYYIEILQRLARIESVLESRK